MNKMCTFLFWLLVGSLSTAIAQQGCPQDFDAYPNLVKNGGFEIGLSDFYTTYKKNTSKDWFSGSIYVTDKPTNVHNNYRLCLDTLLYKDLGKMLVVDGAENRSLIVWQQTITVEPTVDYYFSLFFATLLKANPAQLEITINGQRLPKPFDYHYQHCKGSIYFYFWNSGAASQAIITIKTYTTELMGNDYILDNIQFFACKRKTKKVEIPIVPVVVTRDSTILKLIAQGKGSPLSKFNAEILYSSDSIKTFKSTDSLGAIYATLKKNDLFLLLKAKGYFVLKDTIRASNSYKDSITTKHYSLQPLDSGSHFTLKDFTFERSSHVLTSESKKELDAIEELLRENPEISLEIHGHTDNQGDALKNYELSLDRVTSVKKYLVEKGIEEKRLKGTGFGGTKPLVGYGTEEERKLNRRVEFIFIK